MRVHVLGIPHSRTVKAASHCAYSEKVRKLGPMLGPLGYELIHYGVGEPESTGWAEHVEVLSPALQRELLGYDPLESGREFIGRDAHVNNACYQMFNRRAAERLARYVGPDDWIALPFGHAHQSAVAPYLDRVIETGIGYPTCLASYRIYESWAYLHWHLGRDQRQAWVSEWVVPNYFDPDDWPLRPTHPGEGGIVLYLGRIIQSKGLNVVWQLARARRDLQFVLCGQGDARPWLTEPNIAYLDPVHGLGRAALMHHARCLLMPTEYVEPFGGVAVESMMTGTPVLTSDHSAFTETVADETWRCHTLGGWLAALEAAPALVHPGALRERMVRRYGLEAIGQRYDRIFRQLPDIRAHGWAAGAPIPARAPTHYAPCGDVTTLKEVGHAIA